MDEENPLPKMRAARAADRGQSGPFSPLPDTAADDQDANAATLCDPPAAGEPFLLADADPEGIEGRLAAEI